MYVTLSLCRRARHCVTFFFHAYVQDCRLSRFTLRKFQVRCHVSTPSSHESTYVCERDTILVTYHFHSRHVFLAPTCHQTGTSAPAAVSILGQSIYRRRLSLVAASMSLCLQLVSRHWQNTQVWYIAVDSRMRLPLVTYACWLQCHSGHWPPPRARVSVFTLVAGGRNNEAPRRERMLHGGVGLTMQLCSYVAMQRCRVIPRLHRCLFSYGMDRCISSSFRMAQSSVAFFFFILVI